MSSTEVLNFLRDNPEAYIQRRDIGEPFVITNAEGKPISDPIPDQLVYDLIDSGKIRMVDKKYYLS
jgi:hypothetical protein